MQTIGQRMEALRAPSGFDYLRVGLSIAVIVWHSIVASYGLVTEHYFWIHYRSICGNILPMFFALSGFLVAGSWERTKNLPQFFGDAEQSQIRSLICGEWPAFHDVARNSLNQCELGTNLS